MNAIETSTKVSEWRWDRFNVRKPTTNEWAARNCFGIEGNTDKARNAMHVKAVSYTTLTLPTKRIVYS